MRGSRRLPAAAAGLLAAALVLAVGAAAQQAPPLPIPTVFLHLSDIHFSVNVKKYWQQFGDREGDVLLWAQQLVPRLGVAAAAITGDLTDSKTSRGDGQQQEAEWQAYGDLLRALRTAGLPEQRIWDVPGNHDVFNMPERGGANDFFSKYAAEGRRRASPQQRVFVHRLEQQQVAELSACPAAWLLGIDPTPEPGLRSPTNFAGLAGSALMTETKQALETIAESQPAECGAPVTIAYCHYPLSTVDSTPHHLPGPPGILVHAARPMHPMQGLTKVLAEHNVSAVLSGHLHSAFGQRLHRVHPTPSGGHMAELETAAWKDDRRFRLVSVDGGSLALLDLFFHTRNAPAMPSRPDAAAMQDPAWREAYEQRGWAVTALEPSAAVVDHIALITSPPDARYSPLGPPAAAAAAAAQPGANSSQGGEGGEGWVKALVYSLDAPGSDAGAGQGLEVGLTGYLPGGGKLFSKPMQLRQEAGGGASSNTSSGSPLLFVAQGETTVSCVGAGGDPAAHCRPPAGHVLIQVSVRGPQGRTSRSPQQPVALRCTPLTHSHQRCWVAASQGPPLPLHSAALEWLGLAFSWPVLVHRLFLGVWALQAGGMLLLPRLLAPRLLPLIAASPLLQCHSGLQGAPLPPAAISGGSLPRLLRTCLSYLLWPAAALFLCASVTEVWAAMLAYSLYLLLGPWLAYPALTGSPPALLFHYGVVGRLGPGAAGAQRWHFVGTPDTMFVSMVHAAFCWLPATLWVACVVARRLQLQPYSPPPSRSSSSSSESAASSASKRRMEGGGVGSSAALLAAAGSSSGTACSSRWSFSAAQLAALLAIAAFNLWALYLKSLALMGPVALALSPGFAWTLPLALLLVVAWGGPRRRCGLGPRKGE